MKAKLLTTTAALALALSAAVVNAQDRNDDPKQRATSQDQRPLAAQEKAGSGGNMPATSAAQKPEKSNDSKAAMDRDSAADTKKEHHRQRIGRQSTGFGTLCHAGRSAEFGSIRQYVSFARIAEQCDGSKQGRFVGR